MALLRISLREIIELNGAVIGFFFIYFFPVALHFRCNYFRRESVEREGEVQEKYA